MMQRYLLFLIVTMILSACGSPAITQEDIGQREWKLAAINNSEPVAGADVTLNFYEDTLNGTTGCNVYNAGFTMDGNTIAISEMIMTLAYCDQPAGIMDQEIMYAQILGEVTQVMMKDGQLTLTTEDGRALVFGE